MGKTDIFTREPCSFVVEAGIATVAITSGDTSFKLIMPVATLVQNYEACGEALADWDAKCGRTPPPVDLGERKARKLRVEGAIAKLERRDH